ncbi:MAG TPA: alpha/beta fold hydrolase [Baekduia sp.]|nr:alpha/beta fold hydrolase [Baekduia sp.]
MSTELARQSDVQGELPAVARLAGTAGAALVDRVQELHEAVAGRSFAGPAAAGSPARVVHDGLARTAYGGVRNAVRGAAGVLGAVAEQHPVARTARPLSGTPRGAFVLGALNGWLGDRLDAEGSPLAVRMAVRVGGQDVVCSPEALREAFPAATPRVAIFLHGLMETEDAWRLGADRGPTYGQTLREHGWTPVFLRVNTGLHISDNGRRLAALLEDLVDGWPVHVERLALVGHSMGGLIARSACHQATADGRAWPRRVRHLVLLGTPHHGAPLERLTARGVSLLARLPEGEPLAALLRSRSAGIKDLRHGALLEDDWRDLDPDLDLDDRRGDVPLPENVRHHVVAATLHADPQHPLSRVLGDLLVLDASAHGRHETRHIAFEPDDLRHLGGLTHFALLNNPAVHELLVEWLCERRALPA